MERPDLVRRARAWADADPDSHTASEVRKLIEASEFAELGDRFGARLEFGTAGLRGVLGGGPNRMNRAVVRRTTLGLAKYLHAKVPDVAQRGVVIGRDARKMSLEFARDACSVLCAQGIPAFFFPEVVPTPVLAFATLHLKTAAAVMVTASHNPPQYNGFKVYWGDGAQIVPPHDSGIAQAIDQVGPANEVPLMSEDEARAKGLWRNVPQSVERAYLDAVATLPIYRKPADLSIVYSAMHGVGGRFFEAAFDEAGFKKVFCVPQQHQPDGNFPTVRFPNPEEPGAMDLATALAEEKGAELVLANDPDADRLAVMARDDNHTLRMLTGNEVGVLLGAYLLTQKPISKKSLVITTIVSSAQLKAIATQLDAQFEECLTGFKWIASRAMELEKTGSEFVFGYEEALGYTVGTVVRDKDGVGAALVFADLAAWCKSRKLTVIGYLEEIQRAYGLFSASQSSFTLPGLQGAELIQLIMKRFRESPPERVGEFAVQQTLDYQAGVSNLPRSNVLTYELAGGSKMTLRPSGTEPKIKIYFELRHTIAAGERVSDARITAEKRLRELQMAGIELAKSRGLP